MLFAAAQPYFAPYAGYFYRIQHADIFVLLDRVQFPLGTSWITRNRFKNEQGAVWLTVPVWRKNLGLQRIDLVRICNQGQWARKHLRTIEHAYANAPYLKEHRPFLEKVFTFNHENITELNFTILRYVMEALQCDTPVVLQSELGVVDSGERLLIEIGRKLGAEGLLAQTQSRKYLNAPLFAAAGLDLQFLHIPNFVYPQLWGDFIANLSVFDLLLNCGPGSRDIISRHSARTTDGP